jgi:hypothetical protein
MHLKLLAPALVLLATVLAPFATHAAPNGGLLVTQIDSERWQVRLIAGTETRHFTGVVDSSAAYYTLRGLQLEGQDSVSLATPRQVSSSMTVYSGGVDALVFSVASWAKLCLRDTGRTGVPIYVGSSLRDATRVYAPVSLQGADACATEAKTSTSGSYSTNTGNFGNRKYNPGHYVALLHTHRSHSYMKDAVRPGVRGVLKRYRWRQLEPRAGVYDFSELKADLDWAAANKVQLIAMIEDKTFKLERPTPAYLDSYTPRNRAGGYTVLRWNPYVVQRWNALVKAMGRFDSHPSFEGIATQETSLGLTDTVLKANGYTPEKYRDAYINMLTSASQSLPTSRVIWYQNFFAGNQSYIGRIAEAVASKGVVMGNPDVLPDNKNLVSKSYPFYMQMKGRMPLLAQVEPVCYSALHLTAGYKTKYWTMPELFRYARDNMHANYMVWVRMPKPIPQDSYAFPDAVPVIANNPTFNR